VSKLGKDKFLKISGLNLDTEKHKLSSKAKK
jgi:hypothetical protein